MNKILAALASWVPTIETADTESIAVLTEIKAAAQAAGEWADEHEAVVQANPATATSTSAAPAT